MTLAVARFTAKVWKPLHLEHMSENGTTFNSESDLRKHCRKHGLESSALL